MSFNFEDNTDWQDLKRQLSPRLLTNHDLHAPKGYTCAAVIIPLVLSDHGIFILFTKRTASVRDHQNQISFPGGVHEKGDKTILETALREMDEEIGVQVPANAIFGALEARKTVTGYFITPFVAMIESLEKMKLNLDEVDKAILIPLKWLSDSNNYAVQPYKRGGAEIENVIFYKPFQGEVIWGITAEITADFVDKIKKNSGATLRYYAD